MRGRKRAPWRSILLLLGGMAPAMAQTPEIGVAASVVPQVSGTPPGRALRSIEVGIDVLRDERIATGPRGRAQMLFRDGSALTVGPDSDVVLDEYVYDPATGTGRMAASIGAGVLRLVGGQLSKREPVTLRTPSATIGIRGGVALYDNGTVTFLFGESLTIDGNGPAGAQRVELRRPGSSVSIGRDGAIGPPGPAPSGAMGGTLAKLEGVAESGGGATEPPTDRRVAATAVAALGSTNAPAAIGPAALLVQPVMPQAADRVAGVSQASQAQTQETQAGDFTGAIFTAVGLRRQPFASFNTATGSFSLAPKNPNTFDRGGTGFAVNNTLSLDFANLGNAALGFGAGSFSASGTTAQGAVSGLGFVSPDRDFFFYALTEAATQTPSFFAGGVPIAGFAAPASGTQFLAHQLVSAFPDRALIPSLPAALNGNLPGAVVSPLYSVLSPSLYAGSGADSRSQFAWAAIAIDGQGIGQRTAFIGTTGRYYVDNNPANPTFGKLVAAGAERGFVRLGSESTPTGNGQLIQVEQGQSQLFDAGGNGFFGTGQQTYFTLGSDNYNAAGGFPLLDTAGYGLSQADLFVGPTATFYSATPAIPQALPAGIGTGRTARTLNGYAAGIFDFGQYGSNVLTSITPLPATVQGNDPFNLSITTDPALNRLRATFKLQESVNSFQLGIEFGDLAFGNNVRSAFIDDNVFAARESEQRPNTFSGSPFSLSRNLLVSSGLAAPTSILPAGVSYCACQYAKWGFFSANGNNNFVLDLGSWVAGELPSIGTLPLSGTATYTGHAVGSVSNGVHRYVAAGSYAQSWDFASKTGNATIGSFDGRTISGAASSGNGRDFSATVSGGGVSGNLVGSFVQGGGDTAAELIGQFSVSGTGYKAVGTVAARR